MIDDDPELGRVRWCNGCREWWPDDAEFWRYYVTPVGSLVHHGYRRKSPVLVSRCRGCYAERERGRRLVASQLIVGRVVETPDGTFLEPLERVQ